jgi:hypothetical protein
MSGCGKMASSLLANLYGGAERRLSLAFLVVPRTSQQLALQPRKFGTVEILAHAWCESDT